MAVPTAAVRILCFGDSHTHFWSGDNVIPASRLRFPAIDILHAGPITAHNLHRKDGPGTPRDRLRRVMEERGGEYAAFLLCAGEIDCRVHIVRHAARNGTSLESAVEATVVRYMEFVDWLIGAYGRPVVLFGPGPSSPSAAALYNPLYPTVGSVFERNHAVRLFNDALADESSRRDGVAHVSILGELLDGDGSTRAGALHDGCHVDRSFLDLAVSRLRQAFRAMGHRDLAALLRPWRITDGPVLRNVAAGRFYRITSVCPGTVPQPVPVRPDADFFFCTEKEPEPYILIDLLTAHPLHSVRLYNRRDGHRERARSITVSATLGEGGFDLLGGGAGPAHFTDTEPLEIVLEDRARPYRFVKLALREEEHFHLSGVEVLAYSFDVGE